MENAEFLETDAKTATRIGREKLIGTWHDAHDFEEAVASEPGALKLADATE